MSQSACITYHKLPEHDQHMTCCKLYRMLSVALCLIVFVPLCHRHVQTPSSSPPAPPSPPVLCTRLTSPSPWSTASSSPAAIFSASSSPPPSDFLSLPSSPLLLFCVLRTLPFLFTLPPPLLLSSPPLPSSPHLICFLLQLKN